MTYRLGILLCACLLLPMAAPAQPVVDRIYGTITTRDGDTFEGLIRWDKNEASWVDVLDGDKTFSETTTRKVRRTIEIFGIEIAEFEDYDQGGMSRTSGIRFGHLESLENTGSNRALLTLRSGQRLELRGGSTDIGNDVRSILIEDPRRGEIEFRWRDIDRVDFRATPRDARSRYGPRLYGTLTTRDGDDFEGYITWDMDEVLADDVLDGEDERGYDRKIRFGTIAVIERNSSSSANVTLHAGEEMRLSGTNDVNDDNNDILVLDPTLGEVRVGWDEFDRVEFFEPRFPVDYESFYSSGQIRGTVYTRDGEGFEGLIRWDNDEEHAWEFLNGDVREVEFEVEFGLIAEIERLSSSGARVTLRDGRTFDLRDSNDVNDDNDGIYVYLRNGDEVRVDWRDFERVVFDKP